MPDADGERRDRAIRGLEKRPAAGTATNRSQTGKFQSSGGRRRNDPQRKRCRRVPAWRKRARTRVDGRLGNAGDRCAPLGNLDCGTHSRHADRQDSDGSSGRPHSSRRQSRQRDLSITPRSVRDERWRGLQRVGYASARFRFSSASSISAVFLYPTVTQSTPAFWKAYFIAALRSSRPVNAPSPTSFILITPMPSVFTCFTCVVTSLTLPAPAVAKSSASILVPLWFMRIIATWSQSFPGNRRNAGSPWTEAPYPTRACLCFASSTPSCQRTVSVG